jgi:hypothetical protein
MVSLTAVSVDTSLRCRLEMVAGILATAVESNVGLTASFILNETPKVSVVCSF